MFGFAQFATLLPYILLAITSFVGLTGYTLNYAQNKVTDDSSDKEIRVEIQESAKTEKTTCIFNQNAETHDQFQNSIDQFINNQELSIKTPPYLVRLFSERLDLSLNQRPPPSYSFA